MKCFKFLFLVSFLFMLQGCFENRRNTDQLCKDNPALRCDTMNISDGQCRIPRTNLIWHRYDTLQDPTTSNKIEEYVYTQKYRKCLEVAAQILPINQPKLKRLRFDALTTAGNDMKRLVDELHATQTPEAYYFLWSQIGDRLARRKFLRLEGQPELNTGELQFKLATLYTDINRDKTLQLLMHSLELNPPKDIQALALGSLASISGQNGYTALSYVWTMVAKAQGVAITSEQNLNLMYDFSETKKAELNNLAQTIDESLKNHKFKKDLIPKKLMKNKKK